MITTIVSGFLIATALSGQPAETGKSLQLTQAEILNADPDPKYSGTASCTYTVVKNGKTETRTATASCFGELSRYAAKQKLEQKIRAEITRSGGSTSGSISISIRKEW